MLQSKRITIVSADGHYALTDPAGYAKYIDAAYRDALGELAMEAEVVQATFQMIRRNLSDIEVVGDAGQTSAAAVNDIFYGEDMEKRLAVLDSEGIAAEVTVSGSESATPFFHEANRPYSPELRAAGVRAHNRYLVELGKQAGSRLILIGESGPCHDMPATIKELEWMAKHGFVSVSLPGMIADSSLPPLASPYYEPFWAACEDLGLHLHMHAGYGAAQGGFVWQFFVNCAAGREFSTNTMEMYDSNHPDSPFSLHMESRQPVWQLMLSGALDRHPKLQLGLIELRSDWIPATLAYLDRRFAQKSPRVELKPSEYWQRNCFAVPSGPHRAEIDQRYEIGVDNLLFGADVPHPEGTWPNTAKYIAAAFQGVPESEARKMLGENAIRIFGLDSAKLDAIAAKIGPTPAQVLGNVKFDQRLLDAFDRRSGYLKPVEDVNTVAIEEALVGDLKAPLASATA